MNPESNISNYQQPGGNYQTTPAGGPQGTTEHGGLHTGYSNKDTLSKSELETLAAMMFLANIPMLPFPANLVEKGSDVAAIGGVTGTKNEFMMEIALKMDAIKVQILNGWQKNLEEIAKMTEQELKSPRYLAWQQQQSIAYVANVETQSAIKGSLASFQSFLNSLAPTDRIQEMDSNQQYMLRVGLANGLENYQQSVNSGSAAAAEALPFVAASMIIGGAFIGQFAAKPAIDAAANPHIQFMQDSINLFVPLIPSDMRAELGLLGALFASGALATAGASNLAELAKGGKAPNDHELAIKYSENIVQLLNNGVISSFVLGSMKNKMDGTNPLSEERKQELLSMVKISLLTTVVGALYKANTKWITGQEFLDLIKGNMKLKEVDANGYVTKYLLSKESVEQLEKVLPMINAELNRLPPSERAKMEERLAQYMDTNPNFERFFDVNKSISSSFQSTPFQLINEK